MNKMKSILTLATLAVIAGTSVGCYTEGYHRRVYEPAGADRYYYGHHYYSPRYERHYYYAPAPRPPGLDLHIGPP